MGYTTVFKGEFKLEPTLNKPQMDYLQKFSETRRMKRNPDMLVDSTAEAVGFADLGADGEYFVSGAGFAGQDNTPDVLDHNEPPGKQPSLWCQWVPNEDGTALIWNGAEKFYEYHEWLKYIIEKFMMPWGIKCNGTMLCCGEDPKDASEIQVVDNA
ncbi:hypothetical protein HK104_003862, partial [Borealophlyctis nickersoniae]